MFLARVEVIVTSVTVYIHPISQLILNGSGLVFVFLSGSPTVLGLGFCPSIFVHFCSAFLLFNRLAYISMRCS